MTRQVGEPGSLEQQFERPHLEQGDDYAHLEQAIRRATAEAADSLQIALETTRLRESIRLLLRLGMVKLGVELAKDLDPVATAKVRGRLAQLDETLNLLTDRQKLADTRDRLLGIQTDTP